MSIHSFLPIAYAYTDAKTLFIVCCTGLLPHVLQDLLTMTHSSTQDSSIPTNHSSSSSSSGAVSDAQVDSGHKAPSRTHHRPGGINRQQQQRQQHDVDVGVVTTEQLQQINHLFKKVILGSDFWGFDFLTFTFNRPDFS